MSTTLRVTGIRANTADERLLHQRRKDMSANQLPAVRQAAERWRTGAGISGGVVAAAGILTAPETLAAASVEQRVQGGLVLLLAVVAALIAIGFGLRASIGWPTATNFATPTAIRDWEKQELTSSIRALRVSMHMTLVTIGLGTVAAAILLFGAYIPSVESSPGPSPSPSISETVEPTG